MKNEKKSAGKRSQGISRRNFMGATAGIFTIVPGSVLAQSGQRAPSDRLNVAAIGAGGMGNSNINNLAGEKIDAGKRVDWDFGNAGNDSANPTKPGPSSPT